MTEQRKPTDQPTAVEDKDGAWAGKRDAIQPEEQTDPPKVPAETPATRAERQQKNALDSGQELPA